ncbi:MAG: SGNH/GDSL hydrolase family protein, partial [Rhodobacteraceae bacterium]|nr:SGNH/GDSL hydrolase family protein [Paracoccaceae bacterium]
MKALLQTPVLLAQAAGVAWRASRLPEAAGKRRGRAGEGAVLRLLIAGDSSAAGVGVTRQADALSGQLVAALADDFAVDWRLEAASGATAARTRARLAGLAPARFDVAVLALGVNDTTRLVAPARWTAQYAALADLLAARFGVGRIYATGVPPLDRFPALPQPLAGVLGARAGRGAPGLAGRARAPGGGGRGGAVMTRAGSGSAWARGEPGATTATDQSR